MLLQIPQVLGGILLHNSRGEGPYLLQTDIRMGAYLAAAQENLYGTLGATTQAYTGTNLLGEPVPRLSLTIEREPLATH